MFNNFVGIFSLCMLYAIKVSLKEGHRSSQKLLVVKLLNFKHDNVRLPSYLITILVRKMNLKKNLMSRH